MRPLKFIFVCILCLTLVFPLASCGAEEREVVFRVSGDYIQWKYTDTELWSNLISISELNESGALSGRSAYDIAVSQGFEGSEKEWIESLVGAKGEDGANGQDGESVYIGENGNWWIGDTDTGVSVLAQNGMSISAVPSFLGKTVSEIQQMPEAQNFVLSYYGDTSSGTVASQSIPAGVIALEGTQIKLYMSNYSDGGAENPTETPTETPSESPSQECEIQLKSITSPISRGQKATVEIIGKPDTEYTINVIYSSGPSQASGLEPAISDENGYAFWTWRVGASTALGTKEIQITDGVSTLTVYIEIVE